MAPPSSGAYILISGQGLVRGRDRLLRHFWILPERRQTGKTAANKSLGGAWHLVGLQPDATSRGFIITNQCYFNKWRWNKPHAGPLPAPRLPPATSAAGKKQNKTPKSLSLAAEDRWWRRQILLLPLSGMLISGLVLLLPLIMTDVGSARQRRVHWSEALWALTQFSPVYKGPCWVSFSFCMNSF